MQPSGSINGSAGKGRSRWALALTTMLAATVSIGATTVHRTGAHPRRPVAREVPLEVSEVVAEAAEFRAPEVFVGTLEPWFRASLGPQYVAARVTSVTVRPGALVRRNQVLATLDCRDSQSAHDAIRAEARATAWRHNGLELQARRVNGLLDGDFVAPVIAEGVRAQSDSEFARVRAMLADTARAELFVHDCTVRAPFDGEVGERDADPGTFARPGQRLLTLVDRTIVRAVGEIPDGFFERASPGQPLVLQIRALGREIPTRITRRAAAADPDTRTFHIEVDLPNRDRAIPVDTTVAFVFESNRATRATEIPATAGDLEAQHVRLVVVGPGGRARVVTTRLVGTTEHHLFVDPSDVPPGTLLVARGRRHITDGMLLNGPRPQTPNRMH